MECQSFCTRCNRHVLARNDEPNHGLHFVLSFLFCPWLLAWVIMTLLSGPFLCTRCGQKVPGKMSCLLPLVMLGIGLAWVAVFVGLLLVIANA